MLGIGYTGCAAPSGCATNNGGCAYKESSAAVTLFRTTCEDSTGAGAGVTCGACPAGYTGTGAAGCTDIDGCAASPCFPGVICVDAPAPGLPPPGYTCGACPEGMRGNGTHCEQCAVSARVLASTVVNGQVQRSADLRVVAGLSLMQADCTNTQGYNFGWSAVTSAGGNVAFESATNNADTLQLFVPKRSAQLLPGLSYTLRFNARHVGNAKVSASLVFDFFVAPAPLEAVVSGGNARLSTGQAFTLDASGSRDPDDETAYAMKYAWKCAAYLSGVRRACGSDDKGNPVTIPTGRAAIGPLKLAGSLDGTEYRWTLTVKKGPRVATSEVRVTVVQPAPGAGLPPRGGIAPRSSAGAVNAGDVLRLVGSVVVGPFDAGAVALNWTASRVKDKAPSAGEEEVNLLAPGLLRTDTPFEKNLVLAPNALAAGVAKYVEVQLTH
jgi:hypothetical protein